MGTLYLNLPNFRIGMGGFLGFFSALGSTIFASATFGSFCSANNFPERKAEPAPAAATVFKKFLLFMLFFSSGIF
ncbi:hypothetical protein ES703_51499 [subsurface metagenome]